MLADGALNMGHARALLGVSDANEQMRLANLTMDKNISVRELEKQIRAIKEGKEQKDLVKPEKNLHIRELEQEFAQKLGTRVTIKTSGKKGHRGRIVIEFYNLSDFDRIKERLK